MTKFELYVAEVLALKRSIGENSWMIGNRLVEIKEKELFLEGYGSWLEFLECGVEISVRSSEMFMRVARNFDQKTVLEWGVYKCDLLLNVEEIKRTEYLKGGQVNVSFRDLKEEVRVTGRPVMVEARREVPGESKSEKFFLETLQLGESLVSALKDFSFRVQLCEEKYKEDWRVSPLKGKVEALEVYELVGDKV